MRPNFFFPFQSNYIQMVKLKIEASVQNHYKNKIGREDWILFQRWRLGILKITFCPSMFMYFSSVKSRLTLNYLMHAWLEIENAYREARGLYGTLRFLRMIMINDSIMLISSRTLLRSTSARLVSLVLEDFFCRQRKLRRVKGKTFFVAETQCQVIIYGNGGQSFPWQEQTFNSHGRTRSTRRTPRCVTIATYNERNYLPHSLRASSPIVKSRRARGTREETRKWLGPTRPRRSLARIRPDR